VPIFLTVERPPELTPKLCNASAELNPFKSAESTLSAASRKSLIEIKRSCSASPLNGVPRSASLNRSA
jgi:hypothetical protein